MGKKLVIETADFAANGIPSKTVQYINDYSNTVLNGSSAFSSANVFYILSSDLSRIGISGETIRYVKLYAKTAGTIKIGRVVNGANTDAYNYTVTQGVNEIALLAPITVGSNSLPSFVGNGILSFWTDNDDDKGFKFNRVGGTASTYSDYRIPISFGKLV
jgi:hypothetical protein